MTYKHKLLFYFILLVSLIEGLSLGYNVYNAYQLRLTIFNEHIELSTKTYAEALRVPSWNLDSETTQNILNSILLDPDVTSIKINYEQNALPSVILNKPALDKQSKQLIKSQTYPIYEPNSATAIAHLEIAVSLKSLNQFLWQLITQAIIELFILVSINLVVIFLILNWMTKPLSQLNQIIKKLAHNELDISIPYTQRKDEIGEVSRSVAIFKQNNIELAELQKSMQEKIEIQTHDLILAKDKAEAGLVSKDQFLSTMSHEIKTPLNGIIGMAQLLNESELSEEDSEYTNIILKSSHDLLHILSDILDYSKLDSNNINLENVPFNFFQHLEDIIKLEKLNNQSKNLLIELNYSSEIPKAFIGDSLRIKQLFFNLINNATKFTSQGKVVISVKYGTKPNTDNELHPLLVQIEDNGIGIDETQLEKILSPFTQADQSNTRQQGGMGLGLSICKKLIDLMDGEMSISSEVNVGTTVDLRLNLLELSS